MLSGQKDHYKIWEGEVLMGERKVGLMGREKWRKLWQNLASEKTIKGALCIVLKCVERKKEQEREEK